MITCPCPECGHKVELDDDTDGIECPDCASWLFLMADRLRDGSLVYYLEAGWPPPDSDGDE